MYLRATTVFALVVALSGLLAFQVSAADNRLAMRSFVDSLITKQMVDAAKVAQAYRLLDTFTVATEIIEQPALPQPTAEVEVVTDALYEGELDIVVVEPAEGYGTSETAAFDHFLRQPNGKAIKLHLKNKAHRALKAGTRVKLRGAKKAARELTVDTLTVLGEPTSTATPTEQGVAANAAPTMEKRSVGVFLVNLTNAKASTYYSIPQVTDILFNAPQSVDNLFQTASFGQVGFEKDANGDGSADVFGPFEVAYDNSTCDYWKWSDAAEAAAAAQGIDMSLYKHRIFVLPKNSEIPQCKWVGMGNISCGTFCRVWTALGDSPMVYAHELGHNLGLDHAGTNPANDGSSNTTYDFSDTVSGTPQMRPLNAPHLVQLNWHSLFSSFVTDVTESGTYTLAPLYADPTQSSLPRVLRFPKQDTAQFYYVSLRQALGYDATLESRFLGGANIHKYKGSGYAPTNHIKTLTNGDSFIDAINQVVVKQIAKAADNSSVTVAVGIGTTTIDTGCLSADPAVTITPTSRKVALGAPAKYTLSLLNRDDAACASSVFTPSFSATTGVSGKFTKSSATIAPGAAATFALTVTPSIAGISPFTVSFTDTDGKAPTHTPTSVTAQVIVDGSAPTAPVLSGTYKPARRAVALTWSGATDDVAVTKYEIVRNGLVVKTLTGTTFTDLPGAGIHTYTVRARDAAGNVSLDSNSQTFTVGS